MQLQRCREIFKSYYPNGKIWKDPTDNKVSVVFDETKSKKVYDYSYSSYPKLLNRLIDSLELMTEYGYKNKKDKLQKLKNKLNKDVIDNPWSSTNKPLKQTQADKDRIKNEINYIKNKVNRATVI